MAVILIRKVGSWVLKSRKRCCEFFVFVLLPGQEYEYILKIKESYYQKSKVSKVLGYYQLWYVQITYNLYIYIHYPLWWQVIDFVVCNYKLCKSLHLHMHVLGTFLYNVLVPPLQIVKDIILTANNRATSPHISFIIQPTILMCILNEEDYICILLYVKVWNSYTRIHMYGCRNYSFNITL